MVQLRKVSPASNWQITCFYTRTWLRLARLGSRARRSLVSRPPPAPFRWPYTWRLNRPEKRRRPGISSTSSNRKVDSTMTYVDSVSVIMATCPRTFLRVYWEVHELRTGVSWWVIVLSTLIGKNVANCNTERWCKQKIKKWRTKKQHLMSSISVQLVCWGWCWCLSELLLTFTVPWWATGARRQVRIPSLSCCCRSLQ